jgi:hypothetical protein
MTMVLILVVALAACVYVLARYVQSLGRRVEADENTLLALDRKVDDLDVPAETALEPAAPEPADEEAPAQRSTPIRRRRPGRPELCAHCGRRPPNRSRHWSGAWLCKVCVRKGHRR